MLLAAVPAVQPAFTSHSVAACNAANVSPLRARLLRPNTQLLASRISEKTLDLRHFFAFLPAIVSL